MKNSLLQLRVFLSILTFFILTSYMVHLSFDPLWLKVLLGGVSSLLLIGFFLWFENFFKRFSLRSFHSLLLGLFVGSLFGFALTHIFQAVAEITQMSFNFQPQTLYLIKASLFLFGTYVGTSTVIHFSDEIWISIPFVKLTSPSFRKKDLLVDASALADARLIDLASTGILDHSLILPRFILSELYTTSELGEEGAKMRAKRCIETLKKLESLSGLGLRYEETHFKEEKDSFSQLLRLARLTDMNILSGDISQVQLPVIEGIRVINLHALSNALKPLMQAGESMRIKVQRLGKEPNQGVGYLEDGTMVVINGAGDFIGETIEVQVLSVKHTSSGRMIFCNTMDPLPSKEGAEIDL